MNPTVALPGSMTWMGIRLSSGSRRRRSPKGLPLHLEAVYGATRLPRHGTARDSQTLLSLPGFCVQHAHFSADKRASFEVAVRRRKVRPQSARVAIWRSPVTTNSLSHLPSPRTCTLSTHLASCPEPRSTHDFFHGRVPKMNGPRNRGGDTDLAVQNSFEPWFTFLSD